VRARGTASGSESRPTRRSQERRPRTRSLHRTAAGRDSPRAGPMRLPGRSARLRPAAACVGGGRAAARAARSASASRADPLSDHSAGCNEQNDRDEPGDEALRHRADVTERPATAIVGMLRVLDVADDRVEVTVADLPRGEVRHQVRAYAYSLGDLDR